MIKFLTIHAGICNSVYMIKKQDKQNMTIVTTKKLCTFYKKHTITIHLQPTNYQSTSTPQLT